MRLLLVLVQGRSGQLSCLKLAGILAGFHAIMIDPVYEDAVQQLKVFNGKKLESTTKEGLDIEDDHEKNKLEELKAMFQPLTKLMKAWTRKRMEGSTSLCSSATLTS